MDEDIKILEELIELSKALLTASSRVSIQKIELQALENLIKGYRELEKQLDSSRKANELLNKTNNELRLEIRTTYSKVVNDIISKFNLGDEYIPKSKIDDKIEKYEEMRKATYTDLTHYGDLRRDTVLEVLQVLQELKEE